MYSKLSNQQKEILKNYGRLHRIHHSTVNRISVKQEYEQVKKEMALHQLNHADYEEYERMEKYVNTANELITAEAAENNNRSYGVFKIVLGAVIFFAGIGLSADTNYFFYGAIFTGIGLLINGYMDVKSPAKH